MFLFGIESCTVRPSAAAEFRITGVFFRDIAVVVVAVVGEQFVFMVRQIEVPVGIESRQDAVGHIAPNFILRRFFGFTLLPSLEPFFRSASAPFLPSLIVRTVCIFLVLHEVIHAAKNIFCRCDDLRSFRSDSFAFIRAGSFFAEVGPVQFWFDWCELSRFAVEAFEHTFAGGGREAFHIQRIVFVQVGVRLHPGSILETGNNPVRVVKRVLQVFTESLVC